MCCGRNKNNIIITVITQKILSLTSANDTNDTNDTHDTQGGIIIGDDDGNETNIIQLN